MDAYWHVPIPGEKTHSVEISPASIFTLISIPRWNNWQTKTTLIVWDIWTGAIIQEAETKHCNKILFCGDQRIITLVQTDQDFYIYDVLNSTQLLWGTIQPSQGTGLGTYWVHDNTLQFTTSTKIGGQFVINTYKLQQTSTPPLHELSSFPVQPHKGGFSFSPVSLHASFVTNTEVVILDVQNSKCLLYTEVTQLVCPPLAHFSPDGCFFACGTQHEIYIWQNTPTGYMLWSSLRPRLPFQEFSWSPISISILCWGLRGIQLVHPGDHPNSLSLDGTKPERKSGNHLVAYSTDWAYVATAQQGDGVVTILDGISGTTQWLINTDMQILEIKITNNTIFVVDKYKLASWHLEPGGIVSGTHEPLAIVANVEYLALSHDCSWIAFVRGRELFLYDIKAQKISESIWQNIDPTNIQFSPDGCQLWFTTHGGSTGDFCMRLDIEGWNSVGGAWKCLKVGLPWINLFSPSGYYIGIDSGWVVDSRGRKLLWLPPHWRAKHWGEVRWEGDFLAFVGYYHQKPVIIEFQS